MVVVEDMMKFLPLFLPLHHLSGKSQAGRTKSRQHPLQHVAMNQARNCACVHSNA
jgi:hypothetical protein